MSIIWLQIASLVYSVLLNIVYFSKNRLANLENKIYKTLLISNVIGLLIELGCFYSVSHMESMPMLNFFVTRLLLAYYIAFLMFYTIYVFTVSYNNDKVDKKVFENLIDKVKKICTCIFLIGTVVVFVLPLQYSQEPYIYSYGPAVNFLTFFFGVVLFLWMVLLLKNFKNVRAKKYLPIIIFIALAGLAGVIQSKYPQILLTTPIETFVVFLMYFTIENPDMRIIRELNRTKKQIEDTNNDKSKFLLNITGEMRKTINELETIANEVINSTEENKTKEEMYQLRYLLSGARIRLDQTLNITTLDHKNIRLMNNTYDFRKIVKEVELHLKKQIPKEVTYRSILSNTIPELLYGESMRMKQILTTLLSNAFAYTENGYVELRVNTIIKYDLCRLIITIEDTGLGMSLHQINDLLSLEANDEQHMKPKNTNNLTLPQVHKLIQMLGGSIDIESKENRGTQIIVTLDQQIVHQQADDLKDIEEIEEVMFNKKKIAVIDNKDGLYKKIIKALDKMDVETIEFKSAKACLDRIRKEKDLDLIICQENLEKIDARNLLEKVQKEELQVPIILVNEEEEYDLKRLKIEGFASAIYEEEITTQLVKKVNIILNKEKNT